MDLFQGSLPAPVAGPREGPFSVPPGDFARPGLVDQAFVERSVAAMREMPDAEPRLRKDLAERIESIRARDLVYGDELDDWTTATRERLWLEDFTAEAILSRLTLQPRLGETGR